MIVIIFFFAIIKFSTLYSSRRTSYMVEKLPWREPNKALPSFKRDFHSTHFHPSGKNHRKSSL